MDPNVKIGVTKSMTYTNCAFETVCASRGYFFDVTYAVCHLFRLNCTYVLCDNPDFGDGDENGTGTGMVGSIQRGEFDTSLPVFTATSRRFKAIDFSHPYFESNYVLATRMPRNDRGNLNFSIVNTFKWQTWCIFGTSLILTTLTILLAKKRRKNFGEHILSTLAQLIMNKHKEKKSSTSSSNPIRLMILFWSLSGIVISAAYTSKLFSDKIIDADSLPFTNVETFVRCLEEEKCLLVIKTSSSSTVQYLTEVETNLGRRLANVFKIRPPLLRPDLTDVPDLILNESKLFFVLLVPVVNYVRFFASFKECEFYTVDLAYKETWSFPVRKNSPLLKILNRAAVPFRENGLADALFSKYSTQRNSVCDGDSKKSKFNSVTNATFYFFGVGTFLGLITLAIENCRFRLLPVVARSFYRVNTN